MGGFHTWPYSAADRRATDMVALGIGYACAAGSAIANGSFAAIQKVPAVANLSPHPVIFNLYVCLGAALSSMLVFPFLQWNDAFAGADGGDTLGDKFEFSPLGLVAGPLLVLAFTFSFLAIPRVGLSIGQGVWGGVAIIVSILWGIIAFGNQIVSIPEAASAFAILLIGVGGIAFCNDIATILEGWCGIERTNGALRPDKEQPLLEDDGGEEGYGGGKSTKRFSVVSDEFGDDMEEDAAESSGGASNFVLGMIFAAVVGLTGGSILVPMHYVPASQQGLVFIPSFGIGIIIAAPIVTVIYFAAAGQLHVLQEQEWAQVKVCLPWGMLSGVIWNIGNILSIPSISTIGFAVAYPMMQCALFVSGVWGVAVFREIQGWVPITTFFVSGGILLGGAALLA